jgi:hypothetical protein
MIVSTIRSKTRRYRRGQGSVVHQIPDRAVALCAAIILAFGILDFE